MSRRSTLRFSGTGVEKMLEAISYCFMVLGVVCILAGVAVMLRSMTEEMGSASKAAAAAEAAATSAASAAGSAAEAARLAGAVAKALSPTPGSIAEPKVASARGAAESAPSADLVQTLPPNSAGDAGQAATSDAVHEGPAGTRDLETGTPIDVVSESPRRRVGRRLVMVGAMLLVLAIPPAWHHDDLESRSSTAGSSSPSSTTTTSTTTTADGGG